MSTLIIAEKPSVARTLAKHLRASNTKDGFIQGNGYNVSWAIGHLVELAPPKAYTDKPWSIQSLPIIPQTFKLQPKAQTKKQLKILQKLIAEATSIINATDAGREGELIFRYILEVSRPKTSSIKRLWVSSYTPEDLDKAFQNLKDQNQFDGLYYAGKARSESDWIYGMNATIGYTLSLMSEKPKSLGRVQTPTCCMIIKRYHDHINFKVEKTFTPSIYIEKDNIGFWAKADEYLLNKEKADNILNQCSNTATAIIANQTESKISPPTLFDLTALQITCNRKLGLTAEQTLQAAQELYEKDKLITYPRTDSSYLNATQKPEIINLLEKLKTEHKEIAKFLDKKLRTISFNDSKVTDHHAIIPTITNAVIPESVKKDVYMTIVERTLAHFSKDGIKVNINYQFESNNNIFNTKETYYRETNWRSILFPNDSTNSKVPKVIMGDVLPITKKESIEGQTQAPPLLTEASLLSLMKNCGKEFDNDVLPEIKKDGIGTPATRSSIIERIISVGYIKRNKKHLIPTDLGLKLYPQIKTFDLADISLTGRIEKGLYKIQNNELSYKDFMDFLTTTIFPNTMKQVLSVTPEKRSDKTYNCPSCRTEKMELYSTQAKCKNCNLSLPFNFFSAHITEEQMKEILEGKTILLKNLKGRKNKKFSANVTYSEEDKRLNLSFEDKPEKKELNLKCPRCGKSLIEHTQFYGCKGYSDGCKFSIPKEKSGHTFTLSDIELLISGGSTSILELTSFKKRKKFSGRFKLNEGKVETLFD